MESYADERAYPQSPTYHARALAAGDGEYGLAGMVYDIGNDVLMEAFIVNVVDRG